MSLTANLGVFHNLRRDNMLYKISPFFSDKIDKSGTFRNYVETEIWRKEHSLNIVLKNNTFTS